MSPKIFSDELLNNIRQRFDIVDVINQYVPLKKSGRNFLGLCPFHSEKTPSFSVSPDKQAYHCFGCSAGGDIIRFVMDIEGLSFHETVVHLADEAKIDIPELKGNFVEDPNEKKKQTIREVYQLASKFYHYLLLETDYGKEAIQYLQKRGFTRDSIETFNIGFAPPAWDTLKNFLLNRGYKTDLLEEAGFIIKNEENNYYDRFRNRIMFPIADAQGRIIAFGGRVLNDSLPKYLNSPETLVFNKSRTVYNLYLSRKEIRKKRQVILFEGYVDTISAYRAGVENGVATLGTSLTEEQAKILKRYSDEIIICYDSDKAGQQASKRAIDVLQPLGFQIKIVQLPQGLDPDDYITKYGPESFKEKVFHTSVTATAFKIDFLRKEYNLKDDSGRINYIQAALDIIADLKHAIEREHYLKVLASEFQLSLDSLKKDMNQIYFQKRKKKENSRDILTSKWNNIINNGNHVGRNKELHPAYYNAEKSLIALMIRDKEIAYKVEQEIGSDFHVEEFAVLAARLYSYYGKGNSPNIHQFSSELEDTKYVNLATQLAIMDMNEDVTDHELNDYIFQVKKYKLELEIKKKRDQQLSAEKNKDYVKSAEIGQEIIQLRNQLKLSNK